MQNTTMDVVQVTTTLDDSVIEVEHLYPQRATRRAWLPLACGGIFAMVAVLAFAKGIALAEANDAARAAWIANGERLERFRPARLSAVYDVLAALGLFGSIACLAFGARGALGRRRSALHQPTFAGSDAGERGVQRPLIEATDGGAVLAPMASMPLSVAAGGDEHGADQAIETGLLAPLADGRLRLMPGARAMFAHGEARILIEATAAPREGSAAAALSMEARSAKYLAGSALVHAGLLALLWSVPPDARTLSTGVGMTEMRLARVDSAALEDRVIETGAGGGQNGETSSEEALQAPPEGVTGTDKSRATSARYTIAKRADTPQLSRSQAIERARQAGILGVYAASDPFGNEWVGTADFSSGFGEGDVRGGLDGPVGEIGGSFGNWGVYQGIGTGPGHGTMHTGSWRRIGRCTGENCTGEGYMSGPGTGPRMTRDEFAGPKVTISRAVGVSGADRSIVRRYIRRKLPQIRHCYERQLLVHPELEGTVTTSFVITPGGAVKGATASGSGNAALDGCVSKTVGTIQFPRFQQMVNVTYPFTFTKAG